MALPNELLATSLEELYKVANEGIIQSSSLSRVHLSRLKSAGYLREIMQGWLMVTDPSGKTGETVEWYSSYWRFISMYLKDRFNDDYQLSAKSSILIRTRTSIPGQLLVVNSVKTSQLVPLPFKTSILITTKKELSPVEVLNGVNVMPLENAICEVGEPFFGSYPLDAEIAMKMIRNPGSILRVLAKEGQTVVAGRLVAAYKFIGMEKFADQIESSLTQMKIGVKREKNPFLTGGPLLPPDRIVTAHASRIKALWVKWRDQVEELAPDIPQTTDSHQEIMQQVEVIYKHDAYNSLSIEGYKVTPELIERVRNGSWGNEDDPKNLQDKAAMAAKGYSAAFTLVKKSISDVLNGKNEADEIESSRQSWFIALFSAGIEAGIVQASNVAGFRGHPVYIRDSMHVPPGKDHIADCMDSLNECMRHEPNPFVRAVLGHYLFVYIHPYFDGNGRTARFMMNCTLVSSGYPWTVIHEDRRKEYFAALEQASAKEEIKDFAEFVSSEMAVAYDYIKAPSQPAKKSTLKL